MPLIQVSLFEGRSLEQKRAFAEQLTRVATETLACSPESVDIIFADIKASDWATAGRLHRNKPA
ncbi:MAG: 4-oxalocrotonate tautomerase [Betaproteobacteria bacterium]|nr:4-oxalocrotonate tautomerase [Betaproteobacteria bacterium]